MAGSWILASICALPVTFFTKIKEIDGLPQCWIDLNNFGWRIYLIYLTSLLLILPTLIIAICYVHIVYTIWSKARLVNDQQQKRHRQQNASSAERIAESSRRSSATSRNAPAAKDTDITLISIKQASSSSSKVAGARKSCLKSAGIERLNGGQSFTIEQAGPVAGGAGQSLNTDECTHQQQVVKFSPAKARAKLNNDGDCCDDGHNNGNNGPPSGRPVDVDLFQKIIGDRSAWHTKFKRSGASTKRATTQDLDGDKVRNNCQNVTDVQMIAGDGGSANDKCNTKRLSSSGASGLGGASIMSDDESRASNDDDDDEDEDNLESKFVKGASNNADNSNNNDYGHLDARLQAPLVGASQSPTSLSSTSRTNVTPISGSSSSSSTSSLSSSSPTPSSVSSSPSRPSSSASSLTPRSQTCRPAPALGATNDSLGETKTRTAGRRAQKRNRASVLSSLKAFVVTPDAVLNKTQSISSKKADNLESSDLNSNNNNNNTDNKDDVGGQPKRGSVILAVQRRFRLGSGQAAVIESARDKRSGTKIAGQQYDEDGNVDGDKLSRTAEVKPSERTLSEDLDNSGGVSNARTMESRGGAEFGLVSGRDGNQQEGQSNSIEPHEVAAVTTAVGTPKEPMQQSSMITCDRRSKAKQQAASKPQKEAGQLGPIEPLARPHPVAQAPSIGRDQDFVAQQHGSGVIPKARIKTIKMTLVIVVAYILCWSPFLILNLCGVFGLIKNDTNVSHALLTLSQSLAHLNSAVNPIIFWLFSSKRNNSNNNKKRAQIGGVGQAATSQAAGTTGATNTGTNATTTSSQNGPNSDHHSKLESFQFVEGRDKRSAVRPWTLVSNNRTRFLWTRR